MHQRPATSIEVAVVIAAGAAATGIAVRFGVARARRRPSGRRGASPEGAALLLAMLRRRPAPAGFTLVEVLVALSILTVGVLGMAATTALVVRQVTASRVAAQRGAALQAAIERVRATAYDSLEGSSGDTIGGFHVAWTVRDAGRSKLVRFVTTGPGLTGGEGGTPAVSDTFVYRVIRP